MEVEIRFHGPSGVFALAWEEQANGLGMMFQGRFHVPQGQMRLEGVASGEFGDLLVDLNLEGCCFYEFQEDCRNPSRFQFRI